MSEAGIQQGDFVRYAHLGVPGIGRVKEARDNPLIEFWNRDAQPKKPSDLTILTDDAGPLALMWDSPEDLASWAKEKPLKLVALSLSIGGGTGNPNSIKEKLADRVISGRDWKNWWSQRAKSLNAFSDLPEPEHFSKSVKGNIYTLHSLVEEVPDDVRAPVSLDDWKNWLLSEVRLPTFGKNPPKVFCDSLSEWPKDTIDRALNRVLWGAGLLLESPKRPSATAALAWMDAVGSIALRRNALSPGGHEPVKQSSDVLARLSQYIQVKEKRKEATLFRVGALSEAPDRQRQLEQARQERESQRADYENRLAQQRQEQESQVADYENRLEQQRQENIRQSASHETKLGELRHAHEAELNSERREQERLRQQVRERNAELDAKREESRLEIRKDMLLAVGEVLQTVARRQGSVDDLAGNVEAGLRLALRAGGADLLDTAPEGKVAAPGVIVRGGAHGDLVLLPAQVKHEAS